MRWTGMAAAAAVFGIGFIGIVSMTPAALAQENQQEIVVERLALMKNIGKHLGAIKKAAAAGDRVQLASNARDIRKMARAITGLFPPTTSGDQVKTRARAAIWIHWAGFVDAANRLEAEATQLAELAQTGSNSAISAQLARMGKQGCGGCHTQFRGPKLK